MGHICMCGEVCECKCDCSPLGACCCKPGCGCSCPCANKEVPMISHVATRVAAKYMEANEPELPDFWMTREEIAAICPPCGQKMAALRIARVKASAIFGQDMLLLAFEQTADKWKKMPKGWTPESRKKLWNSLGGSISSCMEKMKGKVDDPGAYCGSLGRAVGVD